MQQKKDVATWTTWRRAALMERRLDWRRGMQSLGGRGRRRTSSSSFLSSELSNSQNKVCYDGEERTEKQHHYPPHSLFTKQ